MIYIAGLGPGDVNLLTLETFSLLRETRVILRTKIHPTVEQLNMWDINYESLDHFYEEEEDFNVVYKKIANEVINLYKAGQGDLTYCVPGNPLMAEKSVLELIELCKKNDIEYEVKAAMSFVDTIISTLMIDPIEGLTILDGVDLKGKNITKENHIIITQVYNQHIASEVKIYLSKFIDDEGEILFIKAAGVNGEAEIRKIQLYELDRQKDVDHLTSLFINKKVIKDNFMDFKYTVDRLREPGGCPWDREQTHKSLKRYLIEESYELIDAIDKEDDLNLKEELGDVLLQVLLHSRIKEEEGVFDIFDVVRHVNDKMISRHPHVFGEMNLNNSKEVLDNWEKLKRKEDGEISLKDKLSNISKSSPAFIRAVEVVKKAKSFGIKKETEEKLIERLRELLKAIGEKQGENEELIEEILYDVTLLADSCGFEPETTLNKKVDKEIIRLSQK